MEADTDRRSFLGFLIVGLGAIFSAILGFPIVSYIVDARHRKAPRSEFKLVEGVNLGEVQPRAPVQGVLRDTRVDGWTLYPSDVLGRVWVVKLQELPANLPDAQAEKDRFLLVFTTICPHLGCSVNLGGPAFACPCHAATFEIDGKRANADNPALRPMDTLEWKLDPDDPNRLHVKFQRFETLKEEKKPIA
jgi:menaquinol-cytochrome c reductase iron-sulfur subunit